MNDHIIPEVFWFGFSLCLFGFWHTQIEIAASVQLITQDSDRVCGEQIAELDRNTET